MTNTILHVANCEKFIPPFISFIKSNFQIKQHEFYLTRGIADHQLVMEQNITLCGHSFFQEIIHYCKLILKFHSAKKVILHGLFDYKVIFILFCMPWILKKSYWVMWGGDLYRYEYSKNNLYLRIKELFRKPVIRNFGYLVTGTIGDYVLASEWYSVKGKHIRCFNYPSNLFKSFAFDSAVHSSINIQVGNSADPSNNHIGVFKALEAFKDKDIKVFCILSYGDNSYLQKVIFQGRKIFGEKFIAVTNFMDFEDYLKFQHSIDIAIFNHERQQALGNIVTLLGLGKTVYLNKKSTLNGLLDEMGIVYYNTPDISLSYLKPSQRYSNINKIKENFSEESLIKSLSSWMI